MNYSYLQPYCYCFYGPRSHKHFRFWPDRIFTLKIFFFLLKSNLIFQCIYLCAQIWSFSVYLENDTRDDIWKNGNRNCTLIPLPFSIFRCCFGNTRLMSNLLCLIKQSLLCNVTLRFFWLLHNFKYFLFGSYLLYDGWKILWFLRDRRPTWY